MLVGYGYGNLDIEKLESIITDNIAFPTDSLNNLLLAPAKRIRPVLAFLFLRANGFEITEKQLDLQIAVELAHTASLIHDDIIDLANKRRGIETLNNQFSDKTAVLTGDYVLSVALKKLVSLNDWQILSDFLDTFSEMVSGEINQYFTHFEIPTIDEYIKKTIQKTAGLFNVSLKSAAKLANTDTKLWVTFAQNFGIAFQIKNDLDNILTDKTDITNGIYTAPVIYSNSIEISDESILKTNELIDKHLKIACDCVSKLPNNKYSIALIELLEYIKNDK